MMGHICSAKDLLTKRSFFFRIVDQTITSLESLFEELKILGDELEIFIDKLFSCSKEELIKHCKDLRLKLKDNSRKESDR